MENGMLLEGLAIAASSVLFLGAAMLLHGALRSRSAAFRHLLLLGAFLGLFCLPALSLLLPTWSLPGSPRIAASEERGGNAGLAANRPVSRLEPEGAAPAEPLARGWRPERTSVPFAPERSGGRSRESLAVRISRHFSLVAAAVWALGALCVLAVQVARWAAAGSIAGRAAQVDNESLRSLVDRIGSELCIDRRVELRESSIAPVSMIWGVIRPCIILPSEFAVWAPDKTAAVLRHELAHVKRNDNIFHFVAGLACAIYWFNPLAWVALRRLHFEREVACDDCVLQAGTAASAYAKHLMEVSMKLSGSKALRVVPAAMAHSSDVKRRLLHVLDPATKRRRAGAGSAAAAIILAICLAAPVSAFRIWSDEKPAPPAPPAQPAPAAAPEVPSAPPGAPLPPDAASRIPAATVPPPASAAPHAPAAVAPPAMPAPLAGTVRNLAVHSSGEGLWSVSGTIQSEEGFVAVDGTMENKAKRIAIEAADVVFDPEAPLGFRFDSRKGRLVVKKTEGKDELTYDARPAGGKDNVDVVFSLNGEADEFDAAKKRELKAIAKGIYETLGKRAARREARKGRELSLSGDGTLETSGDILIFRDSAAVREAGDKIGIVRLGPDGKVAVVDTARGISIISIDPDGQLIVTDPAGSIERDRLERARPYLESRKDRSGRSAERAPADRVAITEYFRDSREARSTEETESILELFRGQRETVLEVMERLEGDSKESYRQIIVGSYENMIAELDEKIEELRGRDVVDRSTERTIELYEDLRDGLKETVGRLKKM